MVTEIDLGKLSNAQNAAPILKALVQPDVASRDVTPIELQEPSSSAPARPGSQRQQPDRTDAAHHPWFGLARPDRHLRRLGF